MAMDVLDMLTVLPVDQIEGPGIRWVKRQFKERCRENGVAYIRSRWGIIWRYFKRTWLELYDPVLWNVHGLTERLVARTSNPLERFNRELNAAFSTPHPSMAMRARGDQRETIRLPGAVELSTESEDSSSDEEDMEMQDSDADKRPRPMRPKTLRV
ncbi:hypothetical protein L915_20338 [Phytophthora nicotianae]|uniref:Uncharacterized protein n=1 Tax=Phytophthora nicotianae TaxID=4792 RepID=W2FRL2_PHYNI|nr:hypothetical protein L915_20338 [Phytophthora nicotianae]